MRQFEEGSVVKHYLAVVTGRPCPANGTIDLPIGPVKDALVPRFGIDSTRGQGGRDPLRNRPRHSQIN